jgi:MFS superfamily sulfate permease-like transporter
VGWLAGYQGPWLRGDLSAGVTTAAVVISQAMGRRIRFRDYALALVALAAVLVLGVLQDVLLAVVVSILTLIHGTNHPPIEVLGRRPGSGRWRGWTGIPPARPSPGCWCSGRSPLFGDLDAAAFAAAHSSSSGDEPRPGRPPP